MMFDEAALGSAMRLHRAVEARLRRPVDPRYVAALTGRPLRKPRPSMADIVAVTARHADMRVEAIMGRSRTAPIAHARQVAMALCMELAGAPSTQVARHFGRDHTTVLYAVEAVKARMTPELEEAMAAIRAEVVEARP